MLKWARDNNCPWSPSTRLWAAVHNHLDVLKWARQQQTPCPWWTLDYLHLHSWYSDHDEDISIDAKHSTLLWLAQHGAFLQDVARAIACSCADTLTHAYLALRALLPTEILNYILTLSL